MLDNLRRHASRDFSATQSFLANKGLTGRIAERDARAADRRFNATINALYGRGLYIAYMEYGADVEIRAPAERADYGFSIPFGGGMATNVTGEMVGCTRTRTILASPGRQQSLLLNRDSQRLALSIQQDLVRRRFAVLTGEDVPGVIEFEPLLDLEKGPGAAIAAAMQLIVAEQDRGNEVFANRLREAHFEETVLSTLLLYHPHSHRWILERPLAAPASRDVKRVIDFLHEHLEAPVTLDMLVAVAGTPGRTLNEHFRAATGFAPMAYLQRLRLHAARRVLMAGAAASVTEVAAGFGFLHFGRFAAYYRRAFGELPSETLARSRRGRQRRTGRR